MVRNLILLAVLIVSFSCESEQSKEVAYISLNGKTMGTTYNVKYQDSNNRDFQSEIDQLLVEVNDDVSTYIPDSYISRFNKSEAPFQYINTSGSTESGPKHFKANLEKSKEVYENSQGFYDPTIMPIVNYWGFGYTEKRAVEEADKVIVDSLMEFVGLPKISENIIDDWVVLEKVAPGVQLDFSAIAKGYGVDVIAQLLEDKGVKNYFVEIGGELRVKGLNPKSSLWVIGINTPDADATLTDFQSKIALQDQAMATSGNYRNFYEVNGIKYAHTISTQTGFPEKNRLLSVTIFAPDCISADAYATACMAMGLEKGMTMIQLLDDIEAYFLFSDDDGEIVSLSTSEKLQFLEEEK